MTAAPDHRPAKGYGRGWKIFGTVLAVVLGVGGLALVAAVVLFLIALNSWGSNK